MIADGAYKQLVADVARDLVTEAVPQELPLFSATTEAYFRAMAGSVGRRAGKDEMLGFGIATGVSFLTPYILEIAGEVVQFLAEQIRKSVKEQSASLIAGAVRKLFRKYSQPRETSDVPPPLTREQLTHLRKLVFDRARQLNLPEDKASLLADSMVGSLAASA
jgi:hypothetical protein